MVIRFDYLCHGCRTHLSRLKFRNLSSYIWRAFFGLRRSRKILNKFHGILDLVQ